jgi:DNA polymerase-3 subunit gamma/tau
VQHELADDVAVGDARSTFEIVGRLVQDGQDIRNVTAEALAHFRNLLLVKTAPGQDDLLDIQADGYEQLRVQAEKFTPGEIARVISLLLAAQNDMRWTTSPRLSLELALVRATIPETDPNPAGVVARLERLERLANLDVAAAPAPSVAGTVGGASDEATIPVLAPSELRSSGSPLTDVPSITVEVPEAVVEEASASAEATSEMPVESGVQTFVHAADAGSVDVAMLRRGWPALMEHLQSTRQAILKALLEKATVATYDGDTVGLAFPPASSFIVEKVIGKTAELQQGLEDVFGIRPAVVCVVREARDKAAEGELPTLLEIVEDEDPPTDEEALRRVQEMFGAQVTADASEPGD